jgi:multidrug efflux pump subunit AcrA (membrane-fusion protein)
MASSDSADSGPLIANHNSTRTASDTPSGSRYRFRTGLEIVRAEEADTASDVTIIDARSGERHVLTADEFRVCQAADGTNTLSAIRQAFSRETGRDFPHGKLFALFRRLRRLGLVEDGAAEKPEPPHRSAKTSQARLAESHAGLTAVTSDEADESVDIQDGDTRQGRDPQRRGGRRSAGGRLGGPAQPGRPRTPSMPSEIPSPTGPFELDDNVGDELDDLDMVRGGKPVGGKLRPPRGEREGRARRGRAAQNFLARAQTDGEGPIVEKEPARLFLFNPNLILGALATATWPLKYLLVPLLLATLAALALAYEQRDVLVQDARTFDASVVSTVIVGLVIANLFSRLLLGTVIRGLGGDVKGLGVALMLGVPRFFIDLGGITALDRRGQLWAHSAAPIARLALFCAGTLAWFFLRESMPSLSHLGLMVSGVSLLALLLSVWPLLPSDGYRWVATYFDRPSLRADAMNAIANRSSATTAGGEASSGALSPVAFYILAVALVFSVLALAAQASFDVATAGHVDLLTKALLPVIGVAIAASIVMVWRYGHEHEGAAIDPTAARQLLVNWTGRADLATDQPTTIGTIGKVFWAVVAAVLLAVAFLPYRYQAAGTFEILPTHRTVVTVGTAGEIEQVSVHEGDWVVANQVLAKLSTKDAQREVTIASTELQRAKAQLAQFDTDKKPTDAKDAGSDLEKSIADAVGDDTDSANTKDNATATNYTKTQAERVARADVERLTRKLAFARDQLSDTTVRAPTAGRVMTPNVQLLTGTYLHRGGELLTLDDTRTLEAEINLPEADVGLVKVGDNVRLRPWANEDREISGQVTGIAPAAQAKSYGTIVRVGASIPNADETLRPAMTGYAKIDGEDMRVWEAFLRRIIRIVRVEFWSWIP